jgi:hypothetical protein
MSISNLIETLNIIEDISYYKNRLKLLRNVLPKSEIFYRDTNSFDNHGDFYNHSDFLNSSSYIRQNSTSLSQFLRRNKNLL